jgi:hypothetical protein
MKNRYSHLNKKIRGWKRRIKQINRWGEDILEPDLEWFALTSSRDIYRRCTISPFYNLEKKHPPLWFYKLIVTKFIAAYDTWKQALDQLGIPYDLQIWLFNPSFIRSEIVSWKMKEFNQQMKFSWESNLVKPFPHETFSSKAAHLNDFEWILADEEIIHFENDFDNADFTLEDLINDGYEKKVQNENEVYYAKRIGDIWIGRCKAIPPTFLL